MHALTLLLGVVVLMTALTTHPSEAYVKTSQPLIKPVAPIHVLPPGGQSVHVSPPHQAVPAVLPAHLHNPQVQPRPVYPVVGHVSPQHPGGVPFQPLPGLLPGRQSDRLRPATRPIGSQSDRLRPAARPYGSQSDRLRPAARPYGSQSDRLRPAARPYGSQSDRLRPAARPYGSQSDRLRPAPLPYGSSNKGGRNSVLSQSCEECYAKLKKGICCRLLGCCP